MKLIMLMTLLLAILFIFGCTSEKIIPKGEQRSIGENMEFSEQMLPKIIKALDLPEDSNISDIKLSLGLLETSSNEEVMQALKDKNILGGRFR